MKHFRFTIGCALCLAILAVAGCKPKPRYQMVGEPNVEQPQSTPTPTPTPTPEATPAEGHPDLKKLGESIGPAVILVTVFDPSGKLLRSGTGFFVSDVGRIITTWHTVEGALNGVAKTADGGIYNIAGILASSPTLDLAVLNAEVKKVPFLVLSKTAKPELGMPVAVIGSALTGSAGAPFEGTISGKESEASEDGLELTPAAPATALGAPVVDQNGEVLGIVAARNGKEETASVVRPLSAVKSVVAQIGSSAMVRWPGEPRPTPTPKPRLVSMPKPVYPSEARFHDGVARSGRYRVNFDANGNVKNIQILQSTGNEVLDRAAITGLQQWKAEPGREGFVTVPLTFQSR